MMPWASAVYAADYLWWQHNRDMWHDCKGLKCTWSEPAAQYYGLIYTPGEKGEGLGTDKMHAGGSSGYMAINLAYFLGASEIYLLGFDMQYTGGKSHWHGDHKRTGNPPPDMMREWVGKFVPMYNDLKRLGIPLINCTRETALTIPRKSLEEVLNAKPC